MKDTKLKDNIKKKVSKSKEDSKISTSKKPKEVKDGVFKKYKSIDISGKSRVIYTKNGSKKQYIKYKNNFVPLVEYKQIQKSAKVNTKRKSASAKSIKGGNPPSSSSTNIKRRLLPVPRHIQEQWFSQKLPQSPLEQENQPRVSQESPLEQENPAQVSEEPDNGKLVIEDWRRKLREETKMILDQDRKLQKEREEEQKKRREIKEERKQNEKNRKMYMTTDYRKLV